MSDYEIEKVLILSTSHIPEDESIILGETADGDCPDLQYVVRGYDYGWMVWAPGDIDNALERLEVIPFTRRLVKLAHELGCQWLRLDQDGRIHEDLPHYPHFSPLEQLAEAADG